MEQTDLLRGSLLSRREVLRLFGATGALWLTGTDAFLARVLSGVPAPLCIVRPEQTEGPFFIDERLFRSDIRSDPLTGSITHGIPLALTLRATRHDAADCRPLQGAIVDLWHCDAGGRYSGVRDREFDTTDQKFLRGTQVTDANGDVRFSTIYPGWYPGRTVHIHFKIRIPAASRQYFDFTSQLYFDDALTDRVHANPLYASRGLRTVRNRHDWIFRRGGDQLMLAPTPTAEGYAATFSIGLLIP